MPFTPINAATAPAQPKRGFVPVAETTQPRGFVPLVPEPVSRAASIVSNDTLPIQPTGAAAGSFEARPALSSGAFDPQSDGYDMATAVAAGLQPDPVTKHWPSRDPRTGMLLKGRNHPTWDLLETGEADAGMQIYQAADGRYYSRPKVPTTPEALPVETTWLERVAGAFRGHDNLSANLADLLVDRIPQIDPATGALLSEEQRRGDRLRLEQRQRDALGVPEATGLGDTAADVLGIIGREAIDPLALMSGMVGAGATGLARLAQLAAAGGVYEGVAATAEQLADSGEITSGKQIAGRAAAGAVLAPAFDAALRGIGAGIKRLVERRRAAKDDKARAEIDALIREGMRAAGEEGGKAGVAPEDVMARLVDVVQGPDGEVVVPSRAMFDSPNLPVPARGFTPLPDAPDAPAAPPASAGPVTIEGAATVEAPQASAAQLADEYERLARATVDPSVRTELLQKAAAARTEAAGEAPKLTPRQRADRARRVDPARDTLDMAIRKLGGIDTDRETDWQGRLLDVPRVFGLGALERPGKGQTLDALAERLWELDYLQSFDQGELAALLARVERGEPVYSRQVRAEEVLPEPARQTDQDFRFERDPVDPLESASDFVIDTDSGTIVPARPIDLDDLIRLEEDEANARAWFEQEEGAGRAEQPGGLRGAGEDGVSERLAPTVEGRSGNQPGPAAGRSADELGADASLGPDGVSSAASTAGRLSDATDPTPGPAPIDPRPTATGDPAGGAVLRAPSMPPLDPTGPPRGQPRIEHVAVDSLPTATRVANDAGEVAHAVAGIRRHAQENLLVVVTDDAGNILRVSRQALGGRNATMVDAGLVAGTAHATPGGTRAWVVHNHPNESAALSEADQEAARLIDDLLRDTGVRAEGVIAIGARGTFTHYHPNPNAPQTPVPTRIPSGVRTERLPVTERRFRQIGAGSDPLPSENELHQVMEALAPNGEGVLLLDSSLRPVGFVPLTRDEMLRLRSGQGSPASKLLRAIDETNATGFAARIQSSRENDLRRVVDNLGAFAARTDTRLDSVINADGISSGMLGAQPAAGATFYANPFDQAIRMAGRTLRNNTAGAVPGGLAGGMAAGSASDEEPGSARWWVDVGFGAAAGALGSAGLFGAARRAGITGKGGIADRGLERTGEFLGKLLGRGPAELEEMKRMQRLMRELLDRQTGEMGAFLRDKFTPTERALMADLIEGRGIVPDLNRVHTQAKVLDDYLSFITAKMKDYGMLPPDIEEGGYLHRYYAKHLGLDKTFQEAKRQSLSGSYTIARGMVDTFNREYLSPGAQQISDEVESLLAEKSALERGLWEKAAKLRGAREVDSGQVLTLPDEAVLRAPPGRASGAPEPEMSIDDAMARTGEIDARLAELRKTDLIEMVGEQGGRVRSFFFTRAEVGRVDTGTDPLLARLQRREPGDKAAPKPTRPDVVKRLTQSLELEPPAGKVDGGGPEPVAPNVDGAVAGQAAPRIDELSPTGRTWQVKATDKDGVKLKRDWTRAERDRWGEIRDAGYRFTRGLAEASHDLSLGKLFRDVSKRREWVSNEAQVTKEGAWVQVPKGKARPGAGLERYGALSGKWVRPDVWRAMKRHGAAPRVLGALGDKRLPLTGATVHEAYRGALQRWKLWHTVYNPVSHFNNTYSNTEMLYMGGYGPGDLARGLAELSRGEKSELWREARDAGLLDTDFGTATLKEGGTGSPLEQLAEELRMQRDDTDASFAVDAVMRAKEWWINSKNAVADADGRWATGAEVAKAMARPAVKGLKFLRKPVDVAARSMQRAYRFEDNVFKLAVFAAERKAGKSVDDARRAASELFFDYNDLPDAVKFIRDFPIGSPFISYTYKAIPAVARNLVRHPERALGLVMAFEAANFASLVSAGMDPDQYLETMDAYSDSLPAWDSGRSLWGARNFVVLPGADNLLALGRSHAVGNPFMADAGDRAASLPGVTAFWGSDVFGGNPLHALYDITVNEDWRGKEIYAPGAPDSTKAKKAAAYLFQSWAPSNVLTPGSYHQVKVLEGLANDARKNPDSLAAPIVGVANAAAEALGFEQFTGLNRAGDEVDSTNAMLGTVGVKRRKIDTDQSVQFESERLERAIQESERHLNGEARKLDEGRISPEQFEAERARVQETIDAAREEIERKQRARETLKGTGLLDRQDDQAAAAPEATELELDPVQDAQAVLNDAEEIEVLGRDADGRATAFRARGTGGRTVQIDIAERDENGRAKRLRFARQAQPEARA